MKIRFESNQQYQLEAIASVVDVFDGQPLAEQVFAAVEPAEAELFEVVAVANRLLLSPEALLANVQKVQERNELGKSDGLVSIVNDDGSGIALNFSVEMETGTGKTYVYLRTIYELHAKYGLKKFIITVPSVAIREGVLSSLRLTKDHFDNLYENVPVDAWIYDSKQVSKLRQFATSDNLQILIINIDAYNKPQNAVIHRENDRLSGLPPIEFIRATHPVVIVDEPQNFEADQAKRALASLNPLCTLRYSATHRNPYNCLYKLDPVRAYDLKLVKQIEVNSVVEDENFNVPYIHLESVKATKTSISAKATLDISDGTTKRKSMKLEGGSDLHALSGGRELYGGYVVEEINATYNYVAFSNGVRLEVGQTQGADQDQLMRFQIRETVKEHLDKELAFSRLPQGERLKVLSLFFIDRVANYRGEEAKIKRWFEEAYLERSALPAYAKLGLPPVGQVHDGYFAQDNKGAAKDTTGTTQADDAAYEKIMQDKERLLSLGEPLRFIFSHSALREGWDNPNVFQICTLNESKSEVKKRQEIGRGLRLPVRENGERSRDPNLNRLTVIANESYKDFAKALQTEIEQDTGAKFDGNRIKNTRERRTIKLKKGWELNPDFKQLWEQIRHHTRYRVEFSSQDLIREAAKALKEMGAVEPPRFRIERGRIITMRNGVETQLAGVSTADSKDFKAAVPDLLTYLQRETELTRSTLAQILIQSGRLADVKKNPQQFLDLASSALRNTLQSVMVEGIKYERLEGFYDMMLFESKELETYLDKTLEVNRSIYDAIAFDSAVESNFAQILDKRDDVEFFLKLPNWFEVDTPLGKYRPDWAIVMTDGEHRKLYFACETKGGTDLSKLRLSERLKILCGNAHFDALEVPYIVESSADNLTAQKVIERRSKTPQ